MKYFLMPARFAASRQSRGWTAFVSAIALAAQFIANSSAQTLAPAFAGLYSIKDAGLLTDGAADSQVVFRPGDSKTLLIGTSIGQGDASIRGLSVARDSANHIVGLTGSSVTLATAHAMDGSSAFNAGMTVGPHNILFYIGGDPFSLGEIKPSSSSPDRTIELSGLGFGGDLGGGSVAAVPPGFPGAEHLKIIHDGTWFDAPLALSTDGAYDVGNPTTRLELPIEANTGGIAFVPAGYPGFTQPAVLIGDPNTQTVSAFDLDANGDPRPDSRRDFINGIAGVGIALDPITGDFVLTGNDPGRLYVVGRTASAPATVQIIDPKDGAQLQPGPIAFDVVADQPTGVIVAVKLYSNGALLDSIQNIGVSHFNNTLGGNLTPGHYAITAVASDSSGLSSTSAVVNVSVAIRPPTVVLSGVVNGQTFPICSTIALAATVTAGSGAVTKVEFFDGDAKLGEATAEPYRWVADNLPAGANVLTAQAIDSFGTRTVSSQLAVNITAELHRLAPRLNRQKQLIACFTGYAGSNYVLEASLNLAPPLTWVPVQTNQASAGIVELIDPEAAKFPQRFYRARLLKP